MSGQHPGHRVNYQDSLNPAGPDFDHDNTQMSTTEDFEWGPGERLVPEVEPMPAAVNRMCATLQKNWLDTAVQCEQRADELSKVADELRRRADILRREAEEIPVAIKETVRGEIESRHRCDFLALVNPLE